MKAVIFAGGFGTRLNVGGVKIPKPLTKIGNDPIIIHILKIYSFYNINDFIICLGYKGELIKKYFLNLLNKSQLKADVKIHDQSLYLKFKDPNWNINLVNTGLATQTGGRLKKIFKFIKNDEIFCFTYGDGLSDININKLINFHKKSKKLCTLTAIQPIQRFGILKLKKNGTVKKFSEKPKVSEWINGGFFVASPKIVNFISSFNDPWEDKPINKIVKNKQLIAYKHKGFWHCLDTPRDQKTLNKLWKSKKAPWKIW
jgi:glucose-1-phosphate cytidylyltransferase